MRRGTRVGQAYVAITADGSGINEEIVDAVDDAGKDIDGKGKEHGDKYGEGFSEGFLDRMRNRVATRLGDRLSARAAAAKAGDEAGETFVDRMSDKVKSMGDKISNELGDRLASNSEGVRRGVSRAFDDDFIDRVGERVGNRFAASLIDGIESSLGDEESNIGKLLANLVSGNGKKKKDEGGIGDFIGRMLGAGSRNNALNLIGKTIGNTISGVEKLIALGSSLGGEGGGIGALFTKMGAGARGLLASLPALAIGLGAVVAVMSVLVSIASALLGIVVALASTIASALVGALAVGAGAFTALAAAAGLVTLAFTSMTNSQIKALSSAFQPLKAVATGLGQIMIRQMVPAFEIWSHQLQVALALVKPLAEVMGGAFARAGTILTASLSGPGFQMLIASLTTTLPRIVTNLSTAFGGFLNGISGVLAAIMPSVQRFSGYLARVATDFARWATSARGQNAVVDFVKRALDALGSLWDFVKAVGGLLSTVLFNPRGQRAGNNIFESMANGVRRFTDYISRENRLENWFKKARKFAKLLGDAIIGIGDVLVALNNSAIIDVIWDIAKALEAVVKWGKEAKDAIDWLPVGLSDAIPGASLLQDAMSRIASDSASTADNLARWQVPGTLTSQLTNLSNQFANLPGGGGGNGIIGPVIDPAVAAANAALAGLTASGNTALDNTFESHGGNMPDPTKGGKKGPTHFEGGLAEGQEWVNPYLAWAAQMLDEAGRVADEIRASAREARATIAKALDDATTALSDLLSGAGRSILDAVSEAATSTDFSAIATSFNALIEQFTNSGALEDATGRAQATIDAANATRNSMIASAQAAYDAAVQAVASASNPAEAKKALEALKKADANLGLATQRGAKIVDEAQAAAQQMINNASASQAQLDYANYVLSVQGTVNMDNVLALISGVAAQNVTLADYAEARRIVAEQLTAANEQLAAAITLRDNYSAQVAESVKSFASLLSAQAKSIAGVEQALTARDITDNLQERLAKIRTFQENLRLLLANGLSAEAYKQIVDAGVEGGSAYAAALVAGGQGSISEVNSLIAQISGEASTLGDAAATRMYQAGVDAARGLVEGLTSLSAELELAAFNLGNMIALAIKQALGIASPSRVLIAMMDNVGDGAVVGLDNQHGKVDAASARLFGRIAASPEVAAYDAAERVRAAQSATGQDGVSGNESGPQWLWTGDIVTPTEDPHAVATEVLNEIVGRL